MQLVFKHVPNPVDHESSKTFEVTVGSLHCLFQLVYSHSNRWAITAKFTEDDWEFRMSTPWYKTKESTTELNRLFDVEITNLTAYSLPYLCYSIKDQKLSRELMARIWSWENFNNYVQMELTSAIELADVTQIKEPFYLPCRRLINMLISEQDFDEARETLIKSMYVAFCSQTFDQNRHIPYFHNPTIDELALAITGTFTFYMVNAIMVFVGNDVDLNDITDLESVQTEVWSRAGRFDTVYPPSVDALFDKTKLGYGGFKEDSKRGYKKIPSITHRDNNGVTLEPGLRRPQRRDSVTSRQQDLEEQTALVILEKLFGERVAAELIRGKELAELSAKEAKFLDFDKGFEIEALVKIRINK